MTPDLVERRLTAILAADVFRLQLGPLFGRRGQARPLVGELRGTAMQQIADWLQKLGMSEYTQRFAENRIARFPVYPSRYWSMPPISWRTWTSVSASRSCPIGSLCRRFTMRLSTRI
jgi:hypothetical protein